MKFKLSKPLKISSVNRVQYRISDPDPAKPSVIMNALVQRPTQLYTVKNGRLLSLQKRNSPEINARVSPVGAKKAMGCPHNSE